MEITFDRSQMLKAVNTAKTFAEGSSSMKILQSTFVSAGFGRVRLTTTDLSIWCQVDLDARTPQPGTVAVPVRTLGTVLKTLPNPAETKVLCRIFRAEEPSAKLLAVFTAFNI